VTFNFVKLPELDFDLNAENTGKGRYYNAPNGQKYPSVTTVLSAVTDKSFLIKWRERIGEKEANKITQKAANRGTKLHKLSEDYLLGNLTDFKMKTLMPFDKMLFNQVRPSLDKFVTDVYCLEQALYSTQLKLAGRVDLIARWKDKITVVDFKTSIKEKKEEWIEHYFIQCSAYATMFTEITSLPIEDIVLVIATEEQLPQLFERKVYNYTEKLHKYINTYHQAAPN